MKNIRNTNIRFNLDKALHRQAWEYLQTRDPKKFPSYSHAVITALVSYFDEYYRQEKGASSGSAHNAGPDSSTLIAIAETVEHAIMQTLPAYLAGYTAALSHAGDPGSISFPESQEKKESAEEDAGGEFIDWGFLGGA